MADWTEKLDMGDLAALIPARAMKLVFDDPDAAARTVEKDFIARGFIGKSGNRIASKKAAAMKAAKPKTAKKAATSYPNWSTAIKAEFHLLVCTKDPKYAKVRTVIGKHNQSATVILVGTIAAAIASVLGIAAGVVVPFVSILLLAMVNVGVNAWCGVANPANPANAAKP